MPYNPAAPPEQRKKAIDEWKRLVDTGKLPPMAPMGMMK
jgi:hypothetical protein